MWRVLICGFSYLNLLKNGHASFLRSSSARAVIPDGGADADDDGPWVVRVQILKSNSDIEFLQAVDMMDQSFDLWNVNFEESSVVLLIKDADEYSSLAGNKDFSVTLDTAQTLALANLQTSDYSEETIRGHFSGFPCYRTVEETYAAADLMVANHPNLATLQIIGQSWEKQQNASKGYDLRILKLTNLDKIKMMSGNTKPRLFLNCAIHAREYATAELCTRFCEWLVDSYGTNPDVSWILDYHEIHVNHIANPDGRKMAEQGILWRKNTNANHCSNSNNTNDIGVDLNRNFQFGWEGMTTSDDDECSASFSGSSPASEPEVSAVQDYLLSIFPIQRNSDLVSKADVDTTSGIFLDIHSHGGDVLWSCGFTTDNPPNDKELWTLGRKYGFYTGYRPHSGSFSTVHGSTKDFAYGYLGIPAYTVELGTDFFQDCNTFVHQILPDNLSALLYMAKVVRTPYKTPAGPESSNVTVIPATNADVGWFVTVTANIDDGRYGTANGFEPTQMIASAEVYLDFPPWEGGTSIAMSPIDGSFDSEIETVTATISTVGLTRGKHWVFVQGTDSDGNIGAVSSSYFDI